MNSSLRHDALIIGGGLAGSSLAHALAREGRSTILIEKTRSPQHKVCGEFLSPECLPFLNRLGVFPERLGAKTIHTVRVAARDVLAEVKLPAPALSLTRQALDEALLQSARKAGAELLRGYSVEQLSRQCTNVWRARLKDGAHSSISLDGNDAFLATGKHDLRGWARETSGSQNALVAMKTYFVLSVDQQTALNGHVEVILFPGGYAGLQLVEGGGANLCALVTREKLRALGGNWDRLLDHMQARSPHLARRLSGAVTALDRPLALSAIPYGYCAPLSSPEPTPWRLGDQAAVIPSFCGEGMAIALHTADLAARIYLSGASPAVFHAQVRDQFAHRLYRTTMLSRLIIAMPSLAQAVRPWPSILSEIFHATRLPQGNFGSSFGISTGIDTVRSA